MSTSPAGDEYIAQLREIYVPLLHENGISHRAVNWGSAGSQHRRFDVLLQALPNWPESLLDAGCGVGELAAVLADRGFTGRYTGVDPLPEMIAAAKARFPALHFDVGTAQTLAGAAAELVVASGILAYCDEDQLKEVVRALYGACTRAAAFNALSSWAAQRDPGEYYHDPLLTLAFCRTLTPWAVLRHDYMPHDFTIYLYRDAQR